MHRQQQHMLPCAALQERRPEDRTASQVKRTLCQGGAQLAQSLFLLLRVQAAQIHAFQVPTLSRIDHLRRHPCHGLEAGAQALVPPHQLPQAATQCPLIQGAFQHQRHRDVVCRTSQSELLEEPQPLLRKRQRNPLTALLSLQR